MKRFELFVGNSIARSLRGELKTPAHVTRAFARLTIAAVLLAFLSLASTSALAQFAGPTPLPLINGWASSPFGNSLPTVEQVSGVVQFRGAVSSGTASQLFTLDPQFRPATDVYIPVDLCNAANGRLLIQSSGVVSVQPEGSFSDAQCFTSLDGASFASSASGYTALTLINGWTNAPFSTSNAAVRKINGVVHFRGAIATTGSNPIPFTLPAAFRPKTEVYVPVDLCNAHNGRLHITASGSVDVQAEGGNFSNAQCFTSLDGAWFVASPAGFKPLTPQNGWTGGPFSTSIPKAGNAYGVVYFMGAIATSGTNATAFTLPVAFRPVTSVWIPVDLCNATKGRIFIDPTGSVTVQAEGGNFSNAQCFTSLDGASFVQ